MTMHHDTPNPPEDSTDTEELDDLDLAVHEMEMLYRCRCVEVPLTHNVTVTDIERADDDQQEPGK